MSSDLGLVCYHNGEVGELSAAILRRVLEPYVVSQDDDFWELSFPDGGGGNMEPLTDEAGFDFCIGDPTGADLFDAIYEIMRQTHTLLWWTGGEQQVTADERIADHLPRGFVEDFDPPALVRSGADILAEIAKT